jgi:hypothetical protein
MASRGPERRISETRLPCPPERGPSASDLRKPLGWGVGAGLVGAAIVGSAIAANGSYYYDGYRRCGWVRQFDAYGNFIGGVRTCNYY